jgi:hypothetical protein
MAAGANTSGMPEGKQASSNSDNQDSLPDDLDLTPGETEDAEPEVTDDDLKNFQDENKVPYSRFKEVNSKKNELEAKYAELEKNTQSQLAIQAAQYEAKLQANKPQEDDFGIIYEDETSSVSSDYENNKTQTNLEKLKGKYKEADEMAVLGWAKVVPNASLDELMEKSHRENVARKEQAIKDLIASKKAKARSVVPTSNLGINLKEEDKPKTLKEASALLKNYLANS